MPYFVRPMRNEDIPQVKVIDREGFPTMLQPPNFERELRNQMTHFYVVCDEDRYIEQEKKPDTPENRKGFFFRLVNLLTPEKPENESRSVMIKYPFICGYVGFWIMADEAHITTIAVKEELQRRGIGELLMMAVIDSARELYARVVTLEVRVSNTGAQQLYLKYGFKQAGVRKHYYTDNREDAYIMTTGDITTAEFKKNVDTLIRTHQSRWGEVRFSLT
ncbi:MAG: ribosomal protein S18-alanine N-acetyltransferase [Dehalococcoidales bacterium]|nr:ribosomal protein S18-alanine N-acetyltransferase [Dehalococcoidales bacterium]